MNWFYNLENWTDMASTPFWNQKLRRFEEIWGEFLRILRRFCWHIWEDLRRFLNFNESLWTNVVRINFIKLKLYMHNLPIFFWLPIWSLLLRVVDVVAKYHNCTLLMLTLRLHLFRNRPVISNISCNSLAVLASKALSSINNKHVRIM